MITILRQHVVRKIWGCYLKGQGHTITLQQNRIQPLTLLFEVGYYNHFWQITSVSNTYSGSITRFDRLLYLIGASGIRGEVV